MGTLCPLIGPVINTVRGGGGHKVVGWGRGGKSSFTPAQSVCVACVYVCMCACVHACVERGGG